MKEECRQCKWHIDCECHRHAPILTPTEGLVDYIAQFPTMLNQDFCGDFEEKRN